MCYSRRKSTQFCNIYIANIGLFTVQTIIIIIFNIRYSQHSCVRTRAPLQQTITRPAGTTRPTLQTTYLPLQRFQRITIGIIIV